MQTISVIIWKKIFVQFSERIIKKTFILNFVVDFWHSLWCIVVKAVEMALLLLNVRNLRMV